MEGDTCITVYIHIGTPFAELTKTVLSVMNTDFFHADKRSYAHKKEVHHETLECLAI